MPVVKEAPRDPSEHGNSPQDFWSPQTAEIPRYQVYSNIQYRQGSEQDSEYSDRDNQPGQRAIALIGEIDAIKEVNETALTKKRGKHGIHRVPVDLAVALNP